MGVRLAGLPVVEHHLLIGCVILVALRQTPAAPGTEGGGQVAAVALPVLLFWVPSRVCGVWRSVTKGHERW